MASPSQDHADRREKEALAGLYRILDADPNPKADTGKDPHFYAAKRLLRRIYRSARMIEVTPRRTRVWGKDGAVVFQVP